MGFNHEVVKVDSIKVVSSVEKLPTTEEQKSSSKVGLNSKDGNQMVHRIIVGGYAGIISIIEFDETIQQLVEMDSLTDSIVGKSPTWITTSHDGKLFYSSNEVNDIDGKKDTGSISCFRLVESLQKLESKEKKTLKIEPIDRILSSPGGTASRHELNSDGTFKSKDKSDQMFSYHATGPHPVRQDHYCMNKPTGQVAAFTDLGGDRVYFHSVDNQTGELTPIETIELKPGSGPRHLIFFVVNETRTDIYLICELSNEILYLEMNQNSTNKSRNIKLKQILSTLPTGVNPEDTTFTGGEIELSFDGKFLYSTTRQTDLKKPTQENSILIFKRDLSNGKLDLNPKELKLNLMGHTPRHFSFSKDPKQKLMVLATHESNLIGIYSRDEFNGELNLIHLIDVKSLPTVAQFIPF
ncbi:uncharacterized protein MELLADRAFT_85965 [Melampsora larici-populina 98AG31]|uniref:3-carboxymuconate cyclase n=1 Tax=Melampsora larici-populina (strain 98AG31 / pathotype 3-4-7) TaxID=747676 RepID=F4RKB0_MELLP|nr:uncharacterized protein MELLADRAFT_85965 [Melampsora larici-populina 98AG31]EGG07210.1 hypothetical protein MELLADRAFT_85965 [Melampsora larici-populina 98AG31]